MRAAISRQCSSQTTPSIRCGLFNSCDEDTSEAFNMTNNTDKKRASSQENLKFLATHVLKIPLIRPSLSTSDLSSCSAADDEASKNCDMQRADRATRSKQQTSSRLINIPTKASLTHEWRKLNTLNKCRECNMAIYFNGRECSVCHFVAHKKCVKGLVIKCNRSLLGSTNSIHNHREQYLRHVFSLSKRPPVQSPIFGQALSSSNGEQVLDLISRFVSEIDTRGLTSKGIYRVSSIKSKVETLCNYYDQNPSNLIDLSSFHPNIIANALKMFLRKLPEPLLTNKLYKSFIDIARHHPLGKESKLAPSEHQALVRKVGCKEEDPLERQKIDGLLMDFRQVVARLPDINRQLAAAILRHLRRVSEMAQDNQMSAKNLSIIFGPTLLSVDENKSSMAIVDNIHQARLVELMIDWAYQIFSTAPSSSDDF